MRVGGNLNIESLQEKDDYREKNSSSGFNISASVTGGKINVKDPDIGASYSRGKIDSRWKSVTGQAGIYAGADGFDIRAEKNTDLKGAVIASEASPEKNKLTTGTLTYDNIENSASYSAGSKGVSYRKFANGAYGAGEGYNMKGLTPVLSVPARGDADSTTKSAIAPGSIDVRENPHQDLSALNRDTSNALNELGRIFDKKKIEEQQELASVFGEEAFKLAHKLPNDGKGTKILVHAAIGGIMSSITGAGFTSGAAGAGLNEAVIKEIDKIAKHDPGAAQIVSAIVGAAAARAAGGNAAAGSAAAASGTKWNYFLIEHPEAFDFDKLAQKTLKRKDGKELSEDEVLRLLQGVSDVFAEHEPTLSNTLNAQSESVKNYKYAVQYLMNQGITGESANEFLKGYNKYLREQMDWESSYNPIGEFDGRGNYVLKRAYTHGIQAYRPQKFWGIDLKTMELIEPPVGDKDNDGSNVNPKDTPPKKDTESIHNILDAAGFIPGIGTPAGLIDAGIYTFKDGDYTSGFIAAATSIPGLKQAKGVASIVKRTMPILTKAEKIAKESKLLTSAGKFREKELEEGYLTYVARKEKQGAPPRDRIDWKEARDYFLNDSPMARGNKFNNTANEKEWYPYNEVNLENRKRLDSYNPEKGEIVSRKATDLEMIDMKTFESYLRELKNKYPPGTKIRSNKYDQIDGQELHGTQILEIPASNRNFERIDEYVALARDKYGITIRFREE